MSNESISEDSISQEFVKVIKDFIKDLLTTFPDKITKNTNNKLLLVQEEHDCDTHSEVVKNYFLEVFNFCKDIYPKLFFDILYEKEELFTNTDSLKLLPDVDFVELWKTDISPNTKATIWKYLQLILFSVVSSINTDESFGDTAKLFEAINHDEFKQKIEETIGEMEDIFKQNTNKEEVDNSGAIPVRDNLPKADELHDHINKMMEGKLGSLAKEIAEETATDFNIDVDGAGSVNDVFKQLFKNPTKLMDLVKNVGTKLDTKIKSGAIKEAELLEEASELLNKMKNMPGMDNLENMFSKMGIPGMGNGAKVDMNAFNRQMQQNLQAARRRDRMRSKLEKSQKNSTAVDGPAAELAELEKNGTISSKGVNQDGIEELIFSTGEPIERSAAPHKKKKKKQKGKKK